MNEGCGSVRDLCGGTNGGAERKKWTVVEELICDGRGSVLCSSGECRKV